MDNLSWTTTSNNGTCFNANTSMNLECPKQNELESTVAFSIFYTWITAINIFIGLIGVLGNAFVILVITTSTHMRSNYTNYFIINQGMLDLSAGLFLILQTIIEDDGRRFESFADDMYCRLWLSRFPLWAQLTGSSYGLIGLTIDRYMAVVHPIWHRNYFRRSPVLAAFIATSWLCGIVPILVFSLSACGIEKGQCMLFYYWTSALGQKIWGVVFVVYQSILLMVMHIFCYVCIAKVVLKTKGEPTTATNPATTVTNNLKSRSVRNVIKTLAVVTLCYFACWVPNQIVWMGLHLGIFKVDLNGIFYHITVILVFCNCCVNPFVYVSKYTQFQKAMRALFLSGRVQPAGGNESSVN